MEPSPKASRKQRAMATKHKIFATALSLFSERPYEDVSVADICKAAEISVGAFYHHYKTKDEVLQEGYAFFDQQTEDAWGSFNPPTALAGIRFLVEAQLSSMEEIGVVAATQFFRNQLTSDKVLNYIMGDGRFFTNTLRSEIARHLGESEGSAHSCCLLEDVLSITRGVIYDWCLHKGGYDLVDKGLRLTEMCIDSYIMVDGAMATKKPRRS